MFKNNSLRFGLGFFMFIGGLYLMLSTIKINLYNMFGSHNHLFMMGDFRITSGSIMIVFMIGVFILFFNHRNPLGWVIMVGSIASLILGVIFNAQFSLPTISAFDLIVILVLLCGGLGFLISSKFGGERRR